MKRFISLVICVLYVALSWSQEAYDDCVDALEICPNETLSVNNIDATVVSCGTCPDNFFPCFIPENTIWLTFTTNSSGGDVNVNFSNLTFVTEAGRAEELQATIIEATTPCDPATFTAIGNCENLQTANFSLNATGLTANTTYYVMVNGNKSGPGITLPAECTFDINVTGTAVDETVPTLGLTADQTTICQGDPVTLTASTTDCSETTDYFWYVNGNLATTTTVNTWVTNSLSDQDSVTVDIQCAGICNYNLSSDTVIFDVTEIDVDAGPNQTIGTGSSTQLEGTTTSSTYSWTPTESLSDPASLTPTASPDQTTTYFLSVTEGNCTISDSVTITVTQKVTIPEAFTPNNDGINDIFRILEIENYPDCIVTIYDRWGQKVFKSTGYTADKWWNGENGGRVVPSGTYFYVIELRDVDETVLRGPITVIY